MTRRALALTAAVTLLALSACTGGSPQPVFTDRGVPLDSLKLVAFNDCADLLNGLRGAAKIAVGPYGFGGGPVALDAGGMVPGMKRAEGNADSAAGPAPAAAPNANPDAYSTTNTHEAGVDEPDLVKTDGKRIVTVAGGVLRVVDAASRAITGTLVVSQDNQADRYGMLDLLLSGDHVLLFRHAYQNGTVGSDLTLVDISGAPEILGRYAIDGDLLDARQIGSTARVVVHSQPRIDFGPVPDRPQLDSIEANQRIIDEAPVGDWLPHYTITDSAGKVTAGQVGCGSVSRPAQYSGTSMLTVLTFDLANAGLGSGEPVSIVADGQTVYANGPSLYVAGDQRWRYMWGMREPAGIRQTQPSSPLTELYKFDISGSGKPRFVAGGQVSGWLLNQYSLSEWNGALRVATTAGQPWDGAGSTESTVYVLTESGGQLRQLGKVGGLGKGERIYAVRFIGTTGYVVTFRRTDPLYTLDLRDPRAPKVTGELKINGYSAYLHPAGDGRLIGVGQDATSQGRVQGLQVSLFDVSNTAQPARLAQYTLKGMSSEAEYNPHAFLYWAPRGLVVLPVMTGLVVLSMRETAINQAGAVSQPGDQQFPIQRSLVIGDTLWTVSMQGLQANDLTTLTRSAWVNFT